MYYHGFIVKENNHMSGSEFVCLLELERYFSFFTDNSIESFRRYLDANGMEYITNNIIRKVATVISVKEGK